MKCAFHPETEAKAVCADCEKPLCDACALIWEEKACLCSTCAARRAAGDVAEDVQQRQIQKESTVRERDEKQKKKRMRYQLVFIGLAVAVAVANLLLYLYRAPLQEGKPFNPADHPLSAALLIDTAIRDYASAHEGRYPQSLEALLGPYLSPEIFQPADLARFSYKRIPPNGYELKAVESGDSLTQAIVFTDKDSR